MIYAPKITIRRKFLAALEISGQIPIGLEYWRFILIFSMLHLNPSAYLGAGKGGNYRQNENVVEEKMKLMQKEQNFAYR